MIDEKVMSEQLAENLKAYRQARKMSQREVAKHVGISGAAISTYEKGEGKLPPLHYAVRLASYFGVTVEQLCGTECSTATNECLSTGAYLRLLTKLLEEGNVSTHIETKDIPWGEYPDMDPVLADQEQFYEQADGTLPDLTQAVITINDMQVGKYLKTYNAFKLALENCEALREPFNKWKEGYFKEINED